MGKSVYFSFCNYYDRFGHNLLSISGDAHGKIETSLSRLVGFGQHSMHQDLLWAVHSLQY